MLILITTSLGSIYFVKWFLSLISRRASSSKHSLSADARRQEGKQTIENMTEALNNCKTGRATWTFDPIEKVLERVRTNKKDAIELLNDILERSLISTKLLNCICEYPHPYEELTNEINEIFKHDSDVIREGSQILHGFPISVKECISLKGRDSTVGTSRRIGIIADEHAVLIQVLKKQGALIFSRTNIPQTMLSYECSNPVFGQTLNPYDLKRGPGGSSGGEGCLIGSFGSVLGIGTDIGGSLRIPAAFSGCCGFKPSSGRISSRGLTSSVPGQEGIKSTSGPMAHEVNGLVILMRALLNDGLMHKLDPTIPNIPFNDAKYPHLPPINNQKIMNKNEEIVSKDQKLRIGWFIDDGFAPPTPGMVRAVQETKQALINKGHELVEFNLTDKNIGKDSIRLFALLIGADQGETLYNHNLHGETVDPILEQLVFLITIPYVVRQTVAFLSRLFGWHRVADLVGAAGRKTAAECWALQAEKKHLIHRTFDQFKALKLDGLICPAGVIPAAKNGLAAELTPMCNYTALFNVLEMPAGVVPTGYVTKEDDDLLKSYRKNDPWDKKVHESANNAIGCPIAVQVAALPWEDEMCLHIMKEVELAVNFKPSGGLVNA